MWQDFAEYILNEVGDEDVADSDGGVVDGSNKAVRVVLQQVGAEEQEEEVEDHIGDDVRHLDERKVPYLIEETQPCKEDGGQGIDTDDEGKPNDVFGMVGIVHPVGDGA